MLQSDQKCINLTWKLRLKACFVPPFWASLSLPLFRVLLRCYIFSIELLAFVMFTNFSWLCHKQSPSRSLVPLQWVPDLNACQAIGVLFLSTTNLSRERNFLLFWLENWAGRIVGLWTRKAAREGITQHGGYSRINWCLLSKLGRKSTTGVDLPLEWFLFILHVSKGSQHHEIFWLFSSC